MESTDDGAEASDTENASTGSSSSSQPGSEASSSDAPGSSSSGTTDSTPMTTSTTVDPDTGSSGSSGDVDEPFEPLCPDDRDFEVAVSGVNQDAHEGRLVWLSAVEPDPATEQYPIVVLLQAAIAGGGFELSCPAGLTENFAYPSLAVVLDANDDGVCSDGDLAFTTQLFGWDAAQRYAFDGDAVYSLEGERPILSSENAWQPVEGLTGFSGEPFCDYFFP